MRADGGTGPYHAASVDGARPAKMEIAVGLLTMMLVGFGGAILLLRAGISEVALGLLLTAWSGIAALAGFAAAWLVRRPPLQSFGIRATSARWLLIGAAAGVFALLMKGVLVLLVSSMIGAEANPQEIYATGGSGGTLTLVLGTLLLGIFTPVGEELLFRGVVTNALLRFGSFVGVVGGALIFALLHGINIIFPVAFLEGVIAGELLRRSGAVWPAVMVHIVYNLPTVPMMVWAQST